MLKYIIKRILIFIPMVLLITFLIYGAMELTPGDALSYMMSPEDLGRLTEAQKEAMREAMGLNDPFLLRYFRWLWDILHGRFGYSLTSGRPIATILGETLPATLELTLSALFISVLFGTILGVISALKKGSLTDGILSVAGVLGLSIPQFFFGMACIILFSLNLGILPVGGRSEPGVTDVWDHLKHLIMPAMVLGISQTAAVMRYSRSSMLDNMNKDFVKTARSKGIPEWRVNLLHGFRVSMTPIVVLVGFRLPGLVGGAVVIESLFQWPGVGMTFKTAVQGQNYPVVMIVALLTVIMTMVASLLIDICTKLLDPRVTLE
ncbi:MAG: ABC transporter permease [Oscillospiraceae bacterium]|nr:ABC transporter permease [Oscillospiraceae bacterium]